MKQDEVYNKLLDVKKSLQIFFAGIYDEDKEYSLDEVTVAEHNVLNTMKDIIDDLLAICE